MSASFSQYASKFLNGRLAPDASLASSQPLFYSFQDSSDGESSTGRRRPPQLQADDLELNDHGEPRLRGDEEVDDPYLRLDEDDGDAILRESVPFINASEAPSMQGGWLAHQTSPLPSRSSTPSSPLSSESPPAHLIEPRQPARTILTQSLLPRDGVSRSVFSLPAPDRIPRHKYNDASWTVLWCTAVTICFLAFIFVLFTTHSPSYPTPYSTLTHTIPLVTGLTVLCTILSYTHVLLLRYFARPVLLATAVFIPISLVISALSAFSGSFIYDGPRKPTTWAATIGLRLFSLTPLLLALLAARSLLSRIPHINRTVDTVRLATSLLLSNPPLLAVSPCLLFAALLATLPFLSLVFRLLLIGYTGDKEWYVRPHAVWMVIGTCMVWVWSWCVVRGILRVTAAGVVGAWFFRQNEASGGLAPDHLQNQMQITRSALARAWGPSIGSICLSALVQSFIGSLALMLRGLRRVTTPAMLPSVLHPLSIPITLLSNILSPLTFSGYTLPYAGLTGDAFFSSSRRAREITSIKRPNVAPPSYSLLSTLLTLSSLSLSTLLALSSYLFTAHTLLRPEHAPLGALFTGSVTFLVSWFCGGVVGDTADALYVCYCLDRESGARNREEVFEVFEGPRPSAV